MIAKDSPDLGTAQPLGKAIRFDPTVHLNRASGTQKNG